MKRDESEVRKEYEEYRIKLNNEVEKTKSILDNEEVMVISKKMDELLNELSPYIEEEEN